MTTSAAAGARRYFHLAAALAMLGLTIAGFHPYSATVTASWRHMLQLAFGL